MNGNGCFERDSHLMKTVDDGYQHYYKAAIRC
jgi:hypothetical protein